MSQIDSDLLPKVVDMQSTRLIYFAALAVCVWLTACGPDWHSIILTPKGPVMERKIQQRFGAEELEHVALLYSQEIDAETLAKFEDASEQDTSLTGTFGADMPADSHNSGTYLYCDSPLGSAAIYTERFGGRHDMAAMLRGQENAFHLVWDIVLLQLDALVADSADYAELRAFLDTTMRADAWDLVLEITVSDLGKDSMTNLSWREETPDDVSEMFMRALHFLDDRGYLTLQEALGMAATELNDEDWHFFALQTFGTSIGRRMGMAEGTMPAAFEALMNYSEEQLAEKVKRFLESDGRVAAKLADIPSGSLEKLVEQAFLFDIDLLDIGGDARKVVLYIPVEPYITNGAWFEAIEPARTGNDDVGPGGSKSHVEWQYPLASVPPGGDLAQVVFAFWAEPSNEFQVEHLGTRVLDDDALAHQCRWRQLLGPSLRDEWDSFIAGLQPGPDLENILRRFRFSVEEPLGDDGPPNAIDSVIAHDVVRSMLSKLQGSQN